MSTNNKEAAADFLRQVASGNIHEAFRLYAADNLVHHNPWFKSDAHSLMLAMEESHQQRPNKHFDVQHVLQDGDLVAVHSWLRQQTTDRGMAVVHLLRFENNRIAELWDIGQQVPEEMENERGMF